MLGMINYMQLKDTVETLHTRPPHYTRCQDKYELPREVVESLLL